MEMTAVWLSSVFRATAAKVDPGRRLPHTVHTGKEEEGMVASQLQTKKTRAKNKQKNRELKKDKKKEARNNLNGTAAAQSQS